MILFSNVFITNARYSQGGLNRVDRLDLYKYCLASYACIDRIADVIIYCQLDAGYEGRWTELESYVADIFRGRNIVVKQESPVLQSDWQKVLEKHPPMIDGNVPILYLGNDDHIFIDSDLSMLYEGLDKMAVEPLQHINTLHFSSWPEGVSTIYGLGEFVHTGRYWETDMLYPDAIQVVNSTFFRHVFFDLDLGNAKMRRTDPFLQNWYPYLGDYAFTSKKDRPSVKKFLPLRELVRHFDAYLHIEMPLEYCPLLEIPKGFFSGNIEIDCLKQRVEDVPLCWRSRIGKLVNEDKADSSSLVSAYNLSHRRAMTAPHMRDWQNPLLRRPAKRTEKFRSFGSGTVLPLEEQYLKIGEKI